MKRSTFFLISLVVITSMVLAACGPTATTVAPATSVPPTAPAGPTSPAPAATGPIPFPTGGKSITLGFSQESDNVNDFFTAMTYSVYIVQMVSAGLAEWDDQNNFIPDLATDVPTAANGGVSADGLTITWHLKPGLLWSDGQPLTSADVKFTWQAILDPSTSCVACGGYDKITSIDTPDDTTVVLHFSELYAPWYTLFTTWGNGGGPIMPQHILQGHTALEGDPFIHWPTISSGPFVITEWVAGDHMTLLPNPNYYKGRPILDRIQIKFLPDPETTLAGMKNGDIDMSPDFTESDKPTIAALEPALHMDAKPGNFFEHYFFNMGITDSTVKDANGNVIGNSDVAGFCPFKDLNVRKAIALGFDRQSIVKNLLFDLTTVPGDLWINSYWDAQLQPYPFDPTTAAQLLDQAGYTVGADGIRHGMCDGVDTKLSFRLEHTQKQIREDMATAFQSDMQKLGIEVTPITNVAGTYFSSYTDNGPLATGNYDMGDYATGFYPDPYPATQDFLCEAVPTKTSPDGQNFYHICDPTLQQLFADTLKSADPATRKPVFLQIQQYLYDNYYYIPIYAWSNIAVYTDRTVMSPWGAYSTWFWDMETWDVK